MHDNNFDCDQSRAAINFPHWSRRCVRSATMLATSADLRQTRWSSGRHCGANQWILVSATVENFRQPDPDSALRSESFSNFMARPNSEYQFCPRDPTERPNVAKVSAMREALEE